MSRLAVVILGLAVATHTWSLAAVAAIATIPLSLRLGYRTAVRVSGLGMRRTGRRRILTGRWS